MVRRQAFVLGAALVSIRCASAPPLVGGDTKPVAEVEGAEVVACRDAARTQGEAKALEADGHLRQALRKAREASKQCPQLGTALVEQLRNELGLVEDPRRVAVVAGADEAKLARLMERAAVADPPTALPLYQQAWTEGQADGRALFGAGRAARALGKKAEAARLFDRAVVEMERAQGAKMVVGASPPLSGQLSWLDGSHIAIGRWRIDTRTSAADEMPVAKTYSADGRWSAWLDEGVFVCQVPCGTPKKLSDAHEHIQDLHFTPDGTAFVIVSAAWGQRFEIPSWKEVTTFHSIGYGAQISDDGLDVAALAFQKLPIGDQLYPTTIWLIDGLTGKRRGQIDGSYVTGFLLAPAGGALAAFRTDKMQLLDGRTGKVRATFGGDDYPLQFSPDGAWLLFKHGESLAWVDAASGKQRVDVPRAQTHAFSPDSKVLATAHTSLRLFDVRTGKERPALGGTFQWPSQLLYAQAGQAIAVLARGQIHLWDLRRGTNAATEVAGRVAAAAFSPDGAHLAAVVEGSDTARRASVWDLQGKLERSIGAAPKASIRGTALAPDGRRVAVFLGKRGALWDLATSAVTWLEGPTSCWRRISFSADGKQISCGDGTGATIWDTSTGERITRPPTVRATVRRSGGRELRASWFKGFPSTLELTSASAGHYCRMSRDERWVAWNQRDWVALAATDGSTSIDLERTKGWVRYHVGTQSVEFSPDAKRLAAVGSKGTLVEWDTHSGTHLRRLTIGAVALIDVAYSGDGRRIAVQDEAHHVTVIDATTGAPIAKLESAASYSGLTLTDDGAVLLIGRSELRRVDDGAVVTLHGGPGGGWAATPEGGLQYFGKPARSQACVIGSFRYPFELCEGWFEEASDLAARVLTRSRR